MGDRLAERDRTHPEPAGPPERPRATNKYAWAVGIVFVMILSVLLFVETLPNSGESLFGPKPGTRLKAFAAPSALGNLEGDANVCQKAPCPDQAGDEPGLRGARRGGREPVRAARAPARAHVLLRPRRRLRAAGRPHRASQGQRAARSSSPPSTSAARIATRSGASSRRVAGRSRWRSTRTAPWPTCTASAAARPRSSRARAERCADVELGNLTEDELRAKAERIAR